MHPRQAGHFAFLGNVSVRIGAQNLASPVEPVPIRVTDDQSSCRPVRAQSKMFVTEKGFEQPD